MADYSGWSDGVFNSGMAGDNTDLLANKKNLVIDIYHIPSKTNVVFKAFVTTYQDKFSSEFNTEEVYGRMDPIQTFKATKRNISLGWDVVSASVKEAKENLQRCTRLFQMLYPSYAATGGGDTGSASTISGGPIFRLKFANLIQDVSVEVSEGNAASAENAGLVGTISGFTYEPDFDAGFFDEGIGTLFPQTINLSMEYTVNHTHQLGWGAEGEEAIRRTDAFPYNMGEDDAGSGTPSTGDSDEAEADGDAVTGG
jgi:hypothetical protein